MHILILSLASICSAGWWDTPASGKPLTRRESISKRVRTYSDPADSGSENKPSEEIVRAKGSLYFTLDSSISKKDHVFSAVPFEKHHSIPKFGDNAVTCERDCSCSVELPKGNGLCTSALVDSVDGGLSCTLFFSFNAKQSAWQCDSEIDFV